MEAKGYLSESDALKIFSVKDLLAISISKGGIKLKSGVVLSFTGGAGPGKEIGYTLSGTEEQVNEALRELDKALGR